MSESRGKEQRQQFNIDLGKRCKTARTAAQLTQESFAELLDVNSQFISDVERGRVGVSLLTLKDMSEILGVTTDYLIKGEYNNRNCNQLTLGNRTIQLSDIEYNLMNQSIDAMLHAFSIHNKP